MIYIIFLLSRTYKYIIEVQNRTEDFFCIVLIFEKKWREIKIFSGPQRNSKNHEIIQELIHFLNAFSNVISC